MDTQSDESYKEIFDNPPTEEEIKTIIRTRLAQSHFDRPGLFDSGDRKLQDYLKKITDALVAKDGIVPDDVKDQFRSELKAWKPTNRAPSPLEDR